MLKRFFTAKWQHKNIAIRQQALSDFDPQKDAEILLKMAADDPSVDLRGQALNKIIVPNHIQQLLTKTTNPFDWITYAVRLNELSPQISLLVDLFNQKKNSWENSEIIKVIASCKELDLANALLIATDDPHALIEVAKNAKSIEMRLAMVDKINDLEVLHRLSKESTNKQVLKLVKEKLSAAKLIQKQIEETQHKAQEFLNSMIKLSQQSWFDPQYEIKVNSLVNKWQQLENDSNSFSLFNQKSQDLKVQYQSALSKCQAIINQNKNEMQQAVLQEDAKNKQQALYLQLIELVDETNETDDLIESQNSINKYESIKTAADFLIKSWDESCVICQPDKKLNINYLKSKSILEIYFSSWENLLSLEVEFNQLIESQPNEALETLSIWIKQWQKLLKKLNWPKNILSPQILLSWIQVAHSIEEKHLNIIVKQKKKSAYINQKLKQLEKECINKNLIAANKLSHYVTLQLKDLNQDFQASMEAKISKIQPLLDELRDWHAFATTPKKQVLCEAMELLQSENVEPLEKANKVRNLQQQWRELKASNATADEALWDRFKKASDIAYLPCLAFYAAQDQLKAENLRHRIEICDQLENIIKDNAWKLTVDNQSSESNDVEQIEAHIVEEPIEQKPLNTDWKNIDQLISKINQQWKKYQAVPDNERQNSQKHFDALNHVIREKLKIEKQKNLDKRVELVDKAKLLISLDNIDEAIKLAINLQNEWKILGLTFFKADREQWQLFRQAIDQIFNKRDQLNQLHRQNLISNQQKIGELTQQIKNLTKVDDFELRSTYESFEALKNDVPLESDLPKKNATQLMVEFDNACQFYQSYFNDLDKRLHQRKFDSYITGAQLLQVAEEKMLLSQSILATKDREVLQDKINKLQLESIDADLLDTRLEKIVNAKQIQANESGTQELLAIALELEIMLAIDSPQDYSQQRMTLQLNKLKEGLGNTLLENEKNQLLINSYKKWLSIGFVNPATRIELDKRQSQIFKHLDLTLI